MVSASFCCFLSLEVLIFVTESTEQHNTLILLSLSSLSLSLCFSLPFCLCLSHSLSLSHTRTHTNFSDLELEVSYFKEEGSIIHKVKDFTVRPSTRDSLYDSISKCIPEVWSTLVHLGC